MSSGLPISDVEPGQARKQWTVDEARALYEAPFNDLLFRAHCVHRENFDPNRVQLSRLLNIKTGGCPEDCGYCPQSAHYDAGVERRDLMDVAHVSAAAEQARAAGSTRFCMGAAWREAKDGAGFDRVLEMVEAVAATGMEVCTTLGTLPESCNDTIDYTSEKVFSGNLALLF